MLDEKKGCCTCVTAQGLTNPSERESLVKHGFLGCWCSCQNSRVKKTEEIRILELEKIQLFDKMNC